MCEGQLRRNRCVINKPAPGCGPLQLKAARRNPHPLVHAKLARGAHPGPCAEGAPPGGYLASRIIQQGKRGNAAPLSKKGGKGGLLAPSRGAAAFFISKDTNFMVKNWLIARL